MPRRQNRPRTRARRAAAAISRLVLLMDALRAPRGCPWDRDQTHRSLRQHLVEETYEAIEAIDRDDADALRQELGDVLLQCVFHAQIAAEAGRFDLADAIDAIHTKLIRRHPHVFDADGRPLTAAARRRQQLDTAAAVKQQWEVIKAAERRRNGRTDAADHRVLRGVPAAMPALLRAHEIGRRVAAVGFDWTSPGEVVDKIEEEVRELRAAQREGRDRTEEELGDLLFAIANLARKLGVEPEAALRAANDKFTRRFGDVEAYLASRGRSVHDADLEELEAAWSVVKTAVQPGVPSPARPPSAGRRSSGRGRAGRRSRR
jgi:MazG family protein